MAKLKWGMIGGGEGSQIGPAHRLGAQADGLFEFTAGALDHRPDAGREYAQRLGVAADRAYGDWHEMLAGEKDRDDRVDLVTVATPNATHFEITKAFLEAGFNVLCEKPMTMTVEEGEEIVRVAEASGKICAVNYCYSAYPMVRQARAMVRAGEIGKVRLVVTNFSHGHHGDATDADNPRVRWRYDPAMAGVSGQFADCGIHALHMASFICDDEVETLVGRFRLDDSQPRVGRRRDGEFPHDGRHGRAALDLVGRDRATARIRHSGLWRNRRAALGIAEQPNQLIYTPVGGRTQIIEKGESGLHDDATAPVPCGHRPSRRLSAGRGQYLLRSGRRDPGRDARWLAGCGRRSAVDGGGAYGRCISPGGRHLDGRTPADVPLGGGRWTRGDQGQE